MHNHPCFLIAVLVLVFGSASLLSQTTINAPTNSDVLIITSIGSTDSNLTISEDVSGNYTITDPSNALTAGSNAVQVDANTVTVASNFVTLRVDVNLDNVTSGDQITAVGLSLPLTVFSRNLTILGVTSSSDFTSLSQKVTISGPITATGSVRFSDDGFNGIELGPKDGTANTLELTDAELDLVTASQLVIGPTTNGPITFEGGITLDSSKVPSISLVTEQGIIDSNTGIDLTASFIAVTARTGIGDVTFLEFDAGEAEGEGLSVTVSDPALGDQPGEIWIQDPDGLRLIDASSEGGNITLSISGAFTVSGSVQSSSGDLMLAGGPLVVSGTVETINSGDISLNSEDEPLFVTGSAVSAGDISIDGDGGDVAISAVSAPTGEITIRSDGSITEAGGGDADADLVARSITMSANGDIWGTSASDPLEIDATGIGSGEGLSVTMDSGPGLINIIDTGSTLRVESVTNVFGNVNLTSDQMIIREINAGSNNATLTSQQRYFFTGTSSIAAANGMDLLVSGDESDMNFSIGLDGGGSPLADTVSVTGAVVLTDDLLGVFEQGVLAPAPGQTFTIISNDGTDPVVGTFEGLAEGVSFVNTTGPSYTISYVGGDGNDVVLTAGSDSDPPLIFSVVTNALGPTTATSLDFVVDFSETVKNFSAADLSITSSGSNMFTDYVINGSGNLYTVTVNVSPATDLVFQLNVVTGGTLTDLAGNALTQGFSSVPVAVESVGSPYTDYTSNAGATPGVNDAFFDNIDGDSFTNAEEFIFDLDSTTLTSVNQRITSRVVMDGIGNAGNSEVFSITIPVPDTMSFGESGSTVRGTVNEAIDLYLDVSGSSVPGGTPDLAVVTNPTPDTTGLPGLSSGYRYVEFQLQDDVSLISRGFMMAEISSPFRLQQTIAGVTIEDVSSELTNDIFNRQAVFSIDGSGLNGNNSHSNAQEDVSWLSRGTIRSPNDLLPAVITYDLEGNYDLSSIRVWNYNEINFSNRGANLVEILVAASVGGPFVSLGNFNFTEAPGDNDPDFSQVIALSGYAATNNVRLVRFNIQSNHGDTSELTGLAEVRFVGVSL